MYQAYDRPKTPTRFNNSQQAKTIETSPFKNGKPNNKYANPSMVSNDVFYEKHYDNPQKQLTPTQMPLGIPTKGYGKMNDYKDRYKQISGQADSKARTPVRSEKDSERGEVRSNLRDSYIQKTRDSGAATPTRSQQGGRFEGQRNPESGARTPTRRTDPNLNELKATGQRTPSDYQNTQSHGNRTPGRGHAEQWEGRRTPTRSQVGQSQRYPGGPNDQVETMSRQSGRSQKSHPSQQSDASRLTNAELVCNNCINRHMVDDKQKHQKDEKARDDQYNRELLANDKLERLREEEEKQRRKEKFRQEATEHWEDAKRIKAQQKEDDKRNEESMKGLFNDRELDEKAAKQLADKRRDQLRRDLKKQMDEKRRFDEQSKRDNEDIPNTGLPIGQEYVNRYDRFRDAHKAALKEQIDEKKRQQEQDKELDKKLQDQYTEDMKNHEKTDKERKNNADQARRDHYKREMERFMAEKDLKKMREEDEKARDLENDQLNKQKERDQERARDEAVKRREDNHLAALKEQMDEAARRKKLEEDERKKYQVPAFKTDKVCKLYDCTECHQKYPPTQLNKVKHEHNDRDPEADYDY